MNKKKFIDLRFCKVYYHKDDPSMKNKGTMEMIKKAFKYNTSFFSKSLPKFNIVFVYSRKELNRFWRQKTPSYIISFVNRKGIVIFSPSVIEKETCWKKSDFYSTMIHEISHLFFKRITNRYTPIWLNEGLASYLQNNKRKPKDRIKITYFTLTRKFNKKTPLRYDVYNLFVWYIINKYKKEKIGSLLNKINKNRNIERIFSKVYGKSIKEMIKDANKI